MTSSDAAFHPQSTPARSGEVVPTVAALRAYAAEIRDAEVARALARLGDLPARDAFVVRALAERVVGKLLDGPTIVLETVADGANTAHVVRRLFRLDVT